MWTMAELCRVYEISRGYKWIKRIRAESKHGESVRAPQL